MTCIDLRRARVRSGGAGDAWASSSRRDAAIARLRSTRKGRRFKALGLRLPPLVMPRHHDATPSLSKTMNRRCRPFRILGQAPSGEET